MAATHIVLAAVAALALAGCGAPPAPPAPVDLLASAPSSGAVEAFATLAPLGSFEWHAAPTYTRTAAARHRAAALLRDGRITRDQAIEVLRQTDQARRLLDEAVTQDADRQAVEAAASLASARAALAVAETILEGR